MDAGALVVSHTPLVNMILHPEDLIYLPPLSLLHIVDDLIDTQEKVERSRNNEVQKAAFGTAAEPVTLISPAGGLPTLPFTSMWQQVWSSALPPPRHYGWHGESQGTSG